MKRLTFPGWLALFSLTGMVILFAATVANHALRVSPDVSEKKVEWTVPVPAVEFAFVEDGEVPAWIDRFCKRKCEEVCRPGICFDYKSSRRGNQYVCSDFKCLL